MHLFLCVLLHPGMWHIRLCTGTFCTLLHPFTIIADLSTSHPGLYIALLVWSLVICLYNPHFTSHPGILTLGTCTSTTNYYYLCYYLCLYISIIHPGELFPVSPTPSLLQVEPTPSLLQVEFVHIYHFSMCPFSSWTLSFVLLLCVMQCVCVCVYSAYMSFCISYCYGHLFATWQLFIMYIPVM